MIDFLVIVYVLYGLFYTGTIFKSICVFILTDKANNLKPADRYDVVIILLLVLLSIICYPFAMGMKKISEIKS